MKENKAGKRIFLSDKTINLACLFGIFSIIFALFTNTLPESNSVELVSKYHWYIWIYIFLMIIVYYLIWKRKKIGLYLGFITVIATFPLNILFHVYKGQYIIFTFIIYLISSIIMIWAGRRIWTNFS